MDKLKEIINNLSQDKEGTLKLMAFFLAFLSFPFSICSLVVSGTANAGFNVFLTAILNYAYAAGACKIHFSYFCLFVYCDINN